jgi:hypothetical protein
VVDFETAFQAWQVIDEEPYADRASLPWWLRKVDLRFYRLQRDPARGARGPSA